MRSTPRERGRIERFLLSFMGPPAIGDPHAPVPAAATPPIARCSTCGQPYDEHQVVRDPDLTYTRCPTTGVS